MEYVLPLKYISGLFVNKHEIRYTKETLVCDCIDFLEDIKKINLFYKKNDDLINACIVGNIDLVKFLIVCGADIHYANDDALCTASYYGRINIVKYLIDNGANVHANYNKALYSAGGNNHFNVVKLLIDNGADFHAWNGLVDEYTRTKIVNYLKSIEEN